MDILRILRGGEEPAIAGGAGRQGHGHAETAPASVPPLDLAAVRERLARASSSGGREYWRSLEELADTAEFRDFLHREFPRHASEWVGGEVSRRRFLQLASASLALGGLTACVRQPSEKIVPYVIQPEEVVPGNPLTFASAATRGGYATGVLVESHLGRPTKVEGNPEHPASLGATDLFAQASILDLYDPDRLQAVTQLGRPRPWAAFTALLAGVRRAQQALGGSGLRILTGTVTSPTLAAQLADLLGELPQARWHVWEPAGRLAAEAGARLSFGEPLEVHYDLRRADVVLTLDADLLTEGPGAVRYARDFTARRRDGREEGSGGREMIRLYAVESTPTATGTLADHRLALPPSEVARFALALAAELGVAGAAAGAAWPPSSRPEVVQWIREVASDLRRAGGSGSAAGAGLVVAGEYAPPAVHALAHAINAALGSLGGPVVVTDPVSAGPAFGTADDPAASLRSLIAEIEAGEVDTLFILGGNPVFTAPADLRLADALLKVERRIYLGLHDDETADYCHWLIPETHFLEGWSDARAFDGTVSIVQPLIEPLYPGAKSAHELVAALAGKSGAQGYDLVKEHWLEQGLGGGSGFEAAWMRAVHDGVVADTALPPRTPSVSGDGVARAAAEIARAEAPAPAAAAGRLELNFRPDPTVWDGRFANNAWLQECPKPLTKLTWDNALLVGVATAERLGVTSTDLVEVRVGERRLQLPVWVLPGHADGAATLHFGYGRRRVGRVGAQTGFDAYALRTAGALWTAPATVERRAGSYKLAATQDHHSMEGRHQVRVGTVERYRAEPDFAQHAVHLPGPEVTMFPDYDYPGHAWGLAVDLSACTGCNACVVACQAENNIPTVGKQQVLNAREMHWIRIDRYFEGSVDDPAIHHQPVMCQQCERAPCELVCPVAATVHSEEGLNDMVYNRCVGTRYCSNNCPYKVRRFNFLKWVDTETEVLKLARNPEVTVRGRGVMEKCTYCIQRIAHGRAAAKREGRTVRDGEVVTACQQVCPSDAIRFGDINDPGAEVRRWKELPLDYTLLAELNTRPRTSYLAKLRNPNPAMETIG